MSCDPFKLWMMAHLDGELGEREEATLRTHLAQCSACRNELDSHRRIKEISSCLRLRQPEDRAWEHYWSRIYNRLERHLAWVFLIAGTVVLGSFLAFLFVEKFLLVQTFPWPLRLGGVLLLAGLILLLLSIWREHWVLRKTDRYEGILR